MRIVIIYFTFVQIIQIMKDRILQFLSAESISPAEFADKIGVQRSSMSHILNGRNYPSASFLQKMLQVYPDLNPRWLMIGDGSLNMVWDSPAASVSSSLDNEADKSANAEENVLNDSGLKENLLWSGPYDSPVGMVAPKVDPALKFAAGNLPHPEYQSMPQMAPASNEIPVDKALQNKLPSLEVAISNEKEIEQVLFFFKDKTFAVYKPS